MSFIRFACPHCQKRFKAPEKAAGRTTECPSCHSEIVVPAVDTGESPPLPAPPPEEAPKVHKAPPPDKHTELRQPSPPEPPDKVVHAPPEKVPERSVTVSSPPNEVTASPPQESPEGLPATEEGVLYPWDPDPARYARAMEYDEAGVGRSFLCKCGEFLNSLLKNETFRALKNAEADLRIYPDMVMVTLRDESPGCLVALIENSPEPLRTLLKIILYPIALMFMMPSFILGVIVMLGAFAVGLFLLVFFWYLVIPAVLVLVGALWVYDILQRKRLAAIAERVLNDPKSPFAVKTLFKFSPIVPRMWMRGDRVGEVMELIRVQKRSKLMKRSLILVIEDNALGKDGCFSVGMGVPLGRLLSKRRRVFVLAIDEGEEAADTAAAAMAEVLGVPVRQGKFSMNRLVAQ